MKSKNIIVSIIFCTIALEAFEDSDVVRRHAALSSAAVGLTMGTATAAVSNFLSGAPDASGIIAMGCSALTQSCFLAYQCAVLCSLGDDHDVRMAHAIEVIQGLDSKIVIPAALLGALAPVIYRKFEGDDVTLNDGFGLFCAVGIIGAEKAARYVTNRFSDYLEKNK
ncbi:MAG: hypothetical protein K2X90_04605 [Candidatus Babeliaceae bacterium]|nr:hypothetical protein [Candidatus Babeliaceae bacterium]